MHTTWPMQIRALDEFQRSRLILYLSGVANQALCLPGF